MLALLLEMENTPWIKLLALELLSWVIDHQKTEFAFLQRVILLVNRLVYSLWVNGTVILVSGNASLVK